MVVSSLCYDLSQNPVFELGKRYINQNETGVLSPLLTTYIYFANSILHYVIHSCPPLTTTSLPHVSFFLLRHYSIIRTKTNHYSDIVVAGGRIPSNAFSREWSMQLENSWDHQQSVQCEFQMLDRVFRLDKACQWDVELGVPSLIDPYLTCAWDDQCCYSNHLPFDYCYCC